MIREPAVEGKFYGGNRESVFHLIEEIEKKNRYDDPDQDRGTTIGAILPHAGHLYSGWQTIPFFRFLLRRNEIPETFVIINPNHTGVGSAVSLDPHEAWKNSIGKIETDQELGTHLAYPGDPSAQQNEHSAEVIIPYLQYFFREYDFKILPVCMKAQSYDTAVKLARDLYQSAESTGRSIQIIASSDFSHFLSPELGYKQDQYVVDMISNKNVSGVEQVINKNQISVCGYGPIMTLMAYANMVDNDYISNILARGHSGEVHASSEVVDYISFIFSTPT